MRLLIIVTSPTEARIASVLLISLYKVYCIFSYKELANYSFSYRSYLDGLDQEVTDDLGDSISDVSKNNSEIGVDSEPHFVNEKLFRINRSISLRVSGIGVLSRDESGSVSHVVEIVSEDVGLFGLNDVFNQFSGDFLFLEKVQL